MKKDAAAIAELGVILREGGLAAIPTETVYGLAANAFMPGAVAKIFAAKGRPQDNPLIVHISEPDELDALCASAGEDAHALARAFWPGPLTIVLKKSGAVPDVVTAGMDTVAVRLPAHPVARAIIKAAGVPLAAPSANMSGSPSPTEAAHVLADLFGKIDAVVDGGACAVGVESTVVSLAQRPYRLLRPGGVTLLQLQAVLGEVTVDKAVYRSLAGDERPAAPGMKYRHYAPSAPLVAVIGNGTRSADYILQAAAGKTAAVLCFDEYLPLFEKEYKTLSYGPERDGEKQARRLFSALRELDAAKPALIFAQCPGDEGIFLAVSNRLKKAAGFDVVSV